MPRGSTAKTSPDSAVHAVHRAPGDFPSGKQGDVLTVEFTVMGIPCLGLNGGPAFKHNERSRSGSRPTTRPRPTAAITDSDPKAAKRAWLRSTAARWRRTAPTGSICQFALLTEAALPRLTSINAGARREQ
jgi:hypothetical protein